MSEAVATRTAEYSVAADYACRCGENPLWHPLKRRLYWTDIPTGRLFWYDPATGTHEMCYQDRPVGGFTFQADGSLLLFRDRCNVVVWRDGQVRETVIEAIPGEEDTRFNDVIADGEGRVFAGTMPTENRPAKLYRIERDGSYEVVMQGIGVANGMGFTPDGQGLYFTDSEAQVIWRLAYDRASGAVRDPQIVVRVAEDAGNPDGMVVDTAGDIWSARWDGWGIYRYSGAGELKEKLALPVHRPTSLMFAGEDRQDVYVTTAGAHEKAEHGELSGALLRLQLGEEGPVVGQGEHVSRIGSAG